MTLIKADHLHKGDRIAISSLWGLMKPSSAISELDFRSEGFVEIRFEDCDGHIVVDESELMFRVDHDELWEVSA